MKARCLNPRFPAFAKYGGRGITIDPRWHDFDCFLADMGPRPSVEHSIDRYPNGNGNYEPGNVRWATRSEQCRNRKSSRAVVRSDGLRFNSMVEAAEQTGGNRRCIRDCCTGRQLTHHGYEWRFA